MRVYGLIDDIRADDSTYLLVAHNGISRVIQSYFYDITSASEKGTRKRVHGERRV